MSVTTHELGFESLDALSGVDSLCLFVSEDERPLKMKLVKPRKRPAKKREPVGVAAKSGDGEDSPSGPDDAAPEAGGGHEDAPDDGPAPAEPEAPAPEPE